MFGPVRNFPNQRPEESLSKTNYKILDIIREKIRGKEVDIQEIEQLIKSIDDDITDMCGVIHRMTHDCNRIISTLTNELLILSILIKSKCLSKKEFRDLEEVKYRLKEWMIMIKRNKSKE